MLKHREHQSKHICYTLFLSLTAAAGRLCCCYTFFNQPLQTVQKCWAKTILLSQTGLACFDFSSSKFKMTFIACNLTSILQFDKNTLNEKSNFY